MIREMRRKERRMEEARARKLLAECPYAVLTTVDGEGQSHSVPVSPVLEGDKVYFHCAHQGEKLDNIARNPRVSLCAVGRAQVLPAEMTVAYESVVAQGRARVAEGEERLHGLLLVCRKFSPGQEDAWQQEIERFPNTVVVCVELTHISGKQNKMD